MDIWKILEDRKGEFNKQVNDLLEDREAILAKMHLWPARVYLAIFATSWLMGVSALWVNVYQALVFFAVPFCIFAVDAAHWLLWFRRLGALEDSWKSSELREGLWALNLNEDMDWGEVASILSLARARELELWRAISMSSETLCSELGRKRPPALGVVGNVGENICRARDQLLALRRLRGLLQKGDEGGD